MVAYKFSLLDIWDRMVKLLNYHFLTPTCEPVGPVTITSEEQANTSSLTVDDVTSGQYVLLCGHPEAFAHKTGQTTLRALARKGMIKAVLD